MAPVQYVRPTLYPLGKQALTSPLPLPCNSLNCLPKLVSSGEGNVELLEARHPCLEVQDDVAFIPNDVKLVRGKKTILNGRYVAQFTHNHSFNGLILSR